MLQIYNQFCNLTNIISCNLSLLYTGSECCVVLKILLLISGISSLYCPNHLHSDYYGVLLGCFPDAPLWNTYSFTDKLYYFCKKKKEREKKKTKPKPQAEAPKLRPVCNLHLNRKVNLNLGFLICCFQAIEANEDIPVASPGRLDETPSKEKKKYSMGLVKIRQRKTLCVQVAVPFCSI